MSRRSIRNYVDLFFEFFFNDFKLRYKRSYLGVLWAVFKPLFQFFILYNVWTMFNAKATRTIFVLIGIVLYHVFQDSLLYGMKSLYNKAHIILKIYFPREIVVFAAASVSLINFFFNFLVIMVLAAFGHLDVSWYKLVVGLWGAAFVSFLFGTAFAVWFSIWFLRFRDIQHIVDLLVYALFWLVPVMYPLSFMKGNVLEKVVVNNPLTFIMEMMRTLVHKNILEWSMLSRPLIIGIIVLTFGLLYFRKAVRKIAEYY